MKLFLAIRKLGRHKVTPAKTDGRGENPTRHHRRPKYRWLRGLAALALLASVVQVSPQPVASAQEAPPPGECEAAGGTSYIDETESGVKVNVSTAQDSSEPSTTWACVSLDGGPHHFGAKAILTLSQPDPLVDETWSYCGDHQETLIAQEWGLIGPDNVPFEVSANQTPEGDVHVCVMVNNVGNRLEIKGATASKASFIREDPGIPAQNPLPSEVSATSAQEELTQMLAETLKGHWAGGWLNPDGTITVAFTPGTPVPPVLYGHNDVHVVIKPYSTARLHSAIETVTTRLNVLLASGVEPGTVSPWPYEAGVETLTNVVEVTVDQQYQNRSSEIEAALADELAAGTVSITYGDAPTYSDNACARYNCEPPFRGGTYTDNGVSACTLGFVMRDWRGVRHQSTAGHCGGGTWGHAGRLIGQAFYSYNQGNVDFQMMLQNNQNEPAPANYVLRDAGTVQITSKINVPDGSLRGNYLCVEGTKGARCGNLAQWDYNWDGRCCFARMDVPACGGDSGAPVLNNATNRAYGFYKGVTHTHGDCTGNAVFTWSANAEAASGNAFTVLLTSTSESLGEGQRMPCGYALMSPNGAYSLQLQCIDGHLVLRDRNGNAVWYTNKYGPAYANSYLIMQNDGHAVEYAPNGQVVWAKPGSGWEARSYMKLQDDTNLVIYKVGGGYTWNRWCNC